MMLTEMLGKDGEMLVAKPEVKEGKKEAALRLLLVEASRHALTSEVLHLLEDEHKAIFDTWGWCVKKQKESEGKLFKKIQIPKT